MSFGGKKWKGGTEKDGKCNKRKRKIGKENFTIGRKRVKLMQKKKKQAKGHDRNKRHHKRGENIVCLERGGGKLFLDKIL
jgi:hypothetical protein